VLQAYGLDDLEGLMNFLAGQFWSTSERITCIHTIRDAALRGLIPELLSWARSVRVSSRGLPVPLQPLPGAGNVIFGTTPQVGLDCSLPLHLVQHHFHCWALALHMATHTHFTTSQPCCSPSFFLSSQPPSPPAVHLPVSGHASQPHTRCSVPAPCQAAHELLLIVRFRCDHRIHLHS
jgi:hypothetical protein